MVAKLKQQGPRRKRSVSLLTVLCNRWCVRWWSDIILLRHFCLWKNKLVHHLLCFWTSTTNSWEQRHSSYYPESQVHTFWLQLSGFWWMWTWPPNRRCWEMRRGTCCQQDLGCTVGNLLNNEQRDRKKGASRTSESLTVVMQGRWCTYWLALK